MSDHLSDEQNAYNAAYIKGRRDMAAEFEAAERALVERLEEVEEVCDEWVDFERGGGPWTRPHDTLEEAVRAALAGDSSHSRTVCPTCGKVPMAECLPSNCSAWKEIPWPSASHSGTGGEG